MARGVSLLDDQNLPLVLSSTPPLSSTTRTLKQVPGFLGPTSYSAVFTEGQNHVEVNGYLAGGDSPDPETKPLDVPDHNTARIQQGCRILDLLADLPKYEPYINRWYIVEGRATSLVPYVRQCIDQVALERKKKANPISALSDLSKDVFTNTSTPLTITSNTSLSEVFSMLTNENLRWETIGIILAVAGISANAADETEFDETNKPQIPWKDLATNLLDSATKCMNFCEAFGHLNDISIWLIQYDFLLYTLVHGDAGYVCWRKLGDLVTAVLALGLHQEPKDASEASFVLTELRRKIFWMAYICDKNFATFFGRPPLLNGKYCSVPMPSDINDLDLSLVGEALNGARRSIDVNGWNTSGIVSHHTWLRASCLSAGFREEILELSLGSRQFSLQERSEDLLRRHNEAYDLLPLMLTDKMDRYLLDRSRDENFFRLQIHMDRVYNEFLLQRTLIKHLRTSSVELVRLSRSLLSTILELTSNRHRLGFYSCDIPWLIALFGLPPAGVLALELLQHSRDSIQTSQNFPRSEVIQNLSILISAINCTVRPTNGNYTICSQARKMLQATLDAILSPKPPSTMIESLAPASGTSTTGVRNDVDMNMWFDETNFDLDFWRSLEDHPLLTWPDVT